MLDFLFFLFFRFLGWSSIKDATCVLILSSPCYAKSTGICEVSLQKVSTYYDRLKINLFHILIDQKKYGLLKYYFMVNANRSLDNGRWCGEISLAVSMSIYM